MKLDENEDITTDMFYSLHTHYVTFAPIYFQTSPQ